MKSVVTATSRLAVKRQLLIPQENLTWPISPWTALIVTATILSNEQPQKTMTPAALFTVHSGVNDEDKSCSEMTLLETIARASTAQN
jgi:hypothetical protein